MKEISLDFSIIGIIHSPHSEPKETPIQSQSSCAKECEGLVEINSEYMDGLKDIEGFSHIILIYFFDRIKTTQLIVKPYLDTESHGIFATRSPARPNKIGISVVELCFVKHNMLYVKNIDILDKTPLLDIKPYVPAFDHPVSPNFKIGWLKNKINAMHNTQDDGRFIDNQRI